MKIDLIKIIILCMFMQGVYASVSEGPYFGVEAGVANQVLNYNVSSFGMNTNSVNLTDSSASALLRANLGYNFNKFNGIELGTTYNFNASHPNPAYQASFSLNATTLDFSYILSVPTVVDKLSVFGRVGFAYDWVNGSNEGCCTGNNGMSSNSFADVLGAGVKYKLSPVLSWRLEWLANGLLFPVNLNARTQQAAWTNQTFQTGINYSF